MAKKSENYIYLVSLYKKIDSFLNKDSFSQDEVPDNIISFCIATERILKIKLYKKNPVLVFDNAKFKDDNSLVAIVLKKEKTIESCNIQNIIDRINIIFSKTFTDDEKQAIRDIYDVRNHFVHGYKTESEIEINDAVIKMEIIWRKVSKFGVKILGEKNVKPVTPKKTYSEEELQEILREQVKVKISKAGIPRDSVFTLYHKGELSTWSTSEWGGERCPRCKKMGFRIEKREPESFSFLGTCDFTHDLRGNSDLYKCKNCNLELTPREYEIAKTLLYTESL